MCRLGADDYSLNAIQMLYFYKQITFNQSENFNSSLIMIAIFSSRLKNKERMNAHEPLSTFQRILMHYEFFSGAKMVAVVCYCWWFYKYFFGAAVAAFKNWLICIRKANAYVLPMDNWVWVNSVIQVEKNAIIIQVLTKSMGLSICLPSKNVLWSYRYLQKNYANWMPTDCIPRLRSFF